LLGPALAALLAAALPLEPSIEVAPPVLVTADERFGAGLVWDGPEGLVLTALHVVEGAAEVRVSLRGAPSVPARVVDVDPALDLALVASAPFEHAAPARLAAAPASGDRVRLLGFPRLRAAALEGVVLDPSRRFAGGRYLEIAGAAEPGASGGPVLDASGAVVGVVDLAVAGRGVTLAVPIGLAAARFPRRAPDGRPPAAAPVSPLAQAPRATPSPRTRED
jgi:serine protease Do